MASKRKQNEAFNSRSASTRPASTTDSIFGSQTLLGAANRAHDSTLPSSSTVLNTSSSWQSHNYGNRNGQSSTKHNFNPGYFSPVGEDNYASDSNYTTDLSHYDGSVAGEPGDMSDFDDILNLKSNPESRMTSESPRFQFSTTPQPTDTVDPQNLSKQAPPSTSARVYPSPATTGSPSPRVGPSNVRLPNAFNQTLDRIPGARALHVAGQQSRDGAAGQQISNQARRGPASHVSSGSGSNRSVSPGKAAHPSSKTPGHPAQRSDRDLSDISPFPKLANPLAEEGLEQAPNRKGISPGLRAPMNEAEIATLDESQKAREGESTKAEVERWLRDTGSRPPKGSSASSTEKAARQRLQTPNFAQTKGDLIEETEDDEDEGSEEEAEWDRRTSIADDSPPTPRASHNHVLQTMASESKRAADDPSLLAERLRRMQLWTDKPLDDDAASVKDVPESSTKAIERYQRKAREVDTISLAATYAPSSRRMSTADTASMYSTTGISQRKASTLTELGEHIPEEPEPEPEPESAPRKESLLNKVSRKLSTQTKKRKESQSSEKRPAVDKSRSDSQGSLPTIKKTTSWNTQPSRGVQHDPSSRPGVGVNPSASFNLTPKRSFLGRKRSTSDVISERRNSALAQQWAESGGPPIAFVRPNNLEVPRVDEGFPTTAVKDEHLPPVPLNVLRLNTSESKEIGHEVDEEEEATTPTAVFGAQAKPIEVPQSATLEGFRTHATKLAPRLEPFLAERIAQEQVKRYQTLVDLKVEHFQHVINNTCSAGQRCANLGTGPKYLKPQRTRADKEEKSAIFQISVDTPITQIEHLGEDEQPQLATFPEGIPAPPVVQLPAEFECPICFKVKRLQKPSDWSKHCFEDLYPFICSFADCAEAKSFNRKADWSRHESERHLKLESWTCSFEDCGHVCHRRDNFVQHLVRSHKMQETKTQGSRRRAAEDDTDVSRLAKECHSETPKRPEEQKCPFCGNFCSQWKKLAVHLANHMKQINLPILALVNMEDPGRYLKPADGDLFDTQSLISMRMEAAAGQNFNPSSGTPTTYYGGSMSPSTMPMQDFPSNAMLYENGQQIVHPAFQNASNTYPGTKNLQSQNAMAGNSYYSNQGFGNHSHGYNSRESTYLDAIDEVRSANRTPTPGNFPPTGPGNFNGGAGYRDQSEGQDVFYPTSTDYGNGSMYSMSPTYEGPNHSIASFDQGSQPLPAQQTSKQNSYYTQNMMRSNRAMSDNSTMPQNAHYPNTRHLSAHNLASNSAMASMSKLHPTGNDLGDGFMPAQSPAARNAAWNAQRLGEQRATYQSNRMNAQTMYFDAPEFDPDNPGGRYDSHKTAGHRAFDNHDIVGDQFTDGGNYYALHQTTSAPTGGIDGGYGQTDAYGQSLPGQQQQGYQNNGQMYQGGY